MPALSLGRSRRDAGAPSEVCGANLRLPRRSPKPAGRRRSVRGLGNGPRASPTTPGPGSITHGPATVSMICVARSTRRAAIVGWVERLAQGSAVVAGRFSHRGSFCRSAGILPALSLHRSRRDAGAPSEVCVANLRLPRSSSKPCGPPSIQSPSPRFARMPLEPSTGSFAHAPKPLAQYEPLSFPGRSRSGSAQLRYDPPPWEARRFACSEPAFRGVAWRWRWHDGGMG